MANFATLSVDVRVTVDGKHVPRWKLTVFRWMANRLGIRVHAEAKAL